MIKTLLAKIALNEKTVKTAGKVALSIAVGITLVVLLLINAVMSIGTEGNRVVVLCSFSLMDIPADMPADEVIAIGRMKQSFSDIDKAVEEYKEQLRQQAIREQQQQAGESDESDDEKESVSEEIVITLTVDIYWLKAVFFVRFFGEPQPPYSEIKTFIVSMIESGTVDWLTPEIEETALEIKAILDTSLYSGEVNATHAGIYEMVKDDNTPFAGFDFAEPITNWRDYVRSEYGMRPNPTSDLHEMKMHNGIDISPSAGTPIYAAQSGTVVIATHSSSGYGNHIVINHGGQITTLYGHCSELFVSVGDTVRKGQLIATVGATGNVTGPHLHFEVIEGGQPVNPRIYLP